MATSGAGSGGTVAPPPPAATEQQQQQQPPAAGSTEQQQAKVRNYPDEPRVGVGIVVLRQLPPANTPEVLLIRRAKEPSKGMWCFPGGSLELGESLVECAVRETLEETGIHLRNAPREGEIFSDTLDFPSPVSSSDAMIRDEQGRLMYHYAIINLAAAPEDPHQPPVPSDDVDAAEWFPVAQLRGLKDLVVHCDQVAERAWQQYTPRS
ncbi:hypothetical protein COHA_006295 [Chlorella ohadii]|uniref:Nudix hydrolase domain-containing protein n=1 Tax=Chlorella ohadii TaxID=2649997 RepID=A0AAD5H0W9_9CHLO|nr:hypothetical protein COHA_006295 [Chlorella ohadii]